MLPKIAYSKCLVNPPGRPVISSKRASVEVFIKPFVPYCNFHAVLYLGKLEDEYGFNNDRNKTINFSYLMIFQDDHENFVTAQPRTWTKKRGQHML